MAEKYRMAVSFSLKKSWLSTPIKQTLTPKASLSPLRLQTGSKTLNTSWTGDRKRSYFKLNMCCLFFSVLFFAAQGAAPVTPRIRPPNTSNYHSISLLTTVILKFNNTKQFLTNFLLKLQISDLPSAGGGQEETGVQSWKIRHVWKTAVVGKIFSSDLFCAKLPIGTQAASGWSDFHYHVHFEDLRFQPLSEGGSANINVTPLKPETVPGPCSGFQRLALKLGSWIRSTPDTPLPLRLTKMTEGIWDVEVLALCFIRWRPAEGNQSITEETMLHAKLSNMRADAGLCHTEAQILTTSCHASQDSTNVDWLEALCIWWWWGQRRAGEESNFYIHSSIYIQVADGL